MLFTLGTHQEILPKFEDVVYRQTDITIMYSFPDSVHENYGSPKSAILTINTTEKIGEIKIDLTL